MPAPKIVIYFTPDASMIERKGEEYLLPSDKTSKGLYQIVPDPDGSFFIEGSANIAKSAVMGSASLTFVHKFAGVEARDLFKVNDYFEIWDENADWCYFRGMVSDTGSDYLGDRKVFTLTLENAGGWVLGDNGIYYLHEKIILKDGLQDLFKEIRGRYGIIGKLEAKTKEMSPNDFVNLVIDNICNKRISLIKNLYFKFHPAIKPLLYNVDDNFKNRRVQISLKLSNIEGSIWNVLKLWEGYPFCEMFLREKKEGTELVWRYSRWRDETGRLCIDDQAKDEKPIVFYADPRAETKEGEFKGWINENTKRNKEGYYNAIHVKANDHRISVPTSIAMQLKAAPGINKMILNEDSVIRHGHRPRSVNLPFVPSHMTPEEFSKAKKPQRDTINANQKNSLAEELAKHTKYLYKMYRNIQDSMNGAWVFQGNLPVDLAKDFMLVTTQDKPALRVTSHMITWYFSATAPRTVLEWSRGFENEYEN